MKSSGSAGVPSHLQQLSWMCRLGLCDDDRDETKSRAGKFARRLFNGNMTRRPK
jgi:hypothetical protein